MKNPIALLTSVLCFACAPAMAADSGLYFDVGLGLSSAKDVKKSDFVPTANFYLGSINASKFDDQASSWSAAIGYKILRYVSADISWVDLGDIKYRATGPAGTNAIQYKARISSSGPAIAANGMLPLGKFEFQARAGVLFAKTTLTEYLVDFTGSDSVSTDAKSKSLFAGIGAAVNFTDKFAIRIGAQRFLNVGDKSEIGEESDVDVFSLGVTFSQ